MGKETGNLNVTVSQNICKVKKIVNYEEYIPVIRPISKLKEGSYLKDMQHLENAIFKWVTTSI